MTNFKAPNEYAWAAWFEALNVSYKYEALEERISRAIRYQPDFWLPEALTWLEIKPLNHVPTPGEARVAWQLVEATARPCYLCAGWPSPEGLRVWLYQPLFLGTQEASEKAAMVWLMRLVERRLPEVLAASRGVMARRLEFVQAWQEGRALAPLTSQRGVERPSPPAPLPGGEGGVPSLPAPPPEGERGAITPSPSPRGRGGG